MREKNRISFCLYLNSICVDEKKKKYEKKPKRDKSKQNIKQKIKATRRMNFEEMFFHLHL